MKTYPESVLNVSNDICNIFLDTVLKEYTYINKQGVALEFICEYMLKKFLKNDDLLLDITEVEPLASMCIIEISLASLKNKGLVDSIENENGENVFFLTDKGKKIRNIIKNTK